MKKLEKIEEGYLETKDFANYLEKFKKDNEVALPVVFLMAKPKGMDDSVEEQERTRMVTANKYQNNKILAMPFYKSISTVLNFIPDDNH